MKLPPPVGSYVHKIRGLDILRGRDCVMFGRGDSHMVTADAAMVEKGWPGGIGVQWVDSDLEEPVVTFSSGLYGGFVFAGSEEPGVEMTAEDGLEIAHPMATVMFAGNCLISTSTYERYTYESRMSGGPLVPLVYRPADPLYFSLQGFWTKEDELTLSGSPLAPAFFTGFTYGVPQPSNQFFLGIQTSL